MTAALLRKLDSQISIEIRPTEKVAGRPNQLVFMPCIEHVPQYQACV